MKTTIKTTAALILFFCLFSFISEAQVPGPGPYFIRNGSSCAMDVEYIVFDGGGNVCYSSGGIVSIPSGNFITITQAAIAANCGGNAMDVVTKVAGPTGAWFVTPYTLTTSTGYAPATDTDCNGVLYTYPFSGFPWGQGM